MRMHSQSKYGIGKFTNSDFTLAEIEEKIEIYTVTLLKQNWAYHFNVKTPFSVLLTPNKTFNGPKFLTPI